MNILIKTKDSDIVTRPDTSLERENRALYLSDDVKYIELCPVIYTKAIKAGKCISENFVERYYNAFNYALLLHIYTEDIDRLKRYSTALCWDKSSRLSEPMYNLAVLESKDNIFSIHKDSKCIYKTNNIEKAQLDNLVCDCSQHISIRIGDILCLELEKPFSIYSKEDGNINLSASYCEKQVCNFDIISI